MPQFDVITFDCYGTLIDWRSGIRDAFARAAASEGVAVDPDALLDAYNDHEPRVEQERYRSYRDVLPTNSLRVPNAWINRLGERPLPGGEPTFEYPDMASFAAAMAG